MNAVRVHETFSHGNFRAVTSADRESLTEAVRDVLAKSPYPSSHLDDGEWITKLWDELLNSGTAERGWCTYRWEWLD